MPNVLQTDMFYEVQTDTCLLCMLFVCYTVLLYGKQDVTKTALALLVQFNDCLLHSCNTSASVIQGG